MTEHQPMQAKRHPWTFYARQGWGDGWGRHGWWHCARRRHQIAYSTARALGKSLGNLRRRDTP